MKSRNPAFANSLACLQHPLTLASIAILLLNDHVWKAAVPSWWTGKLSDFAGLFFFPFIVAAGLSLAFSKFKLSRQRIGQIAFGLTAAWFALLKISPVVNTLTAQFASLFLGAQTRLILDPTDLVTLAILWPAWALWQNRAGVAVSRKAYVSLAVGVVACLATSYPPVFENVTALAYQNGILYAQSTTTYEIAESVDYGESWKLVDVSPEERRRLDKLFTERSLPIQVCDPGNEKNCYMIDGTDKVYASNDGGKTWQVDWEIPPSRREYVLRAHDVIESLDLLLVEDGDTRYLLAAMYTNGILRRTLPDGEWIPLAVEKAEPASFYAPDILTAMNIVGKELSAWAGLAFLALLIAHVLVGRKFSSDEKVMNALDWIAIAVGSTIVFIILEYLVVAPVSLFFGEGALKDGVNLLEPGHPHDALLLILAIGVLFAWFIGGTMFWVSKHVADYGVMLKVIFYCAFILIGVFFLGALPWPLWAQGVIERYQSALLISISVSILIAASGYRLILNAK